MKRKKIIFSLVAVLLITGIIGHKLMATTLAEEKNSDEISGVKYKYDTKDDGWEYAFKLYFLNDGSVRISFNGYNMRYKELDGYYIKYIDEDTKEVLYTQTPAFPTLSVSEVYGDDVKNINNYFNEKQFKESISISDLNELQIDNFDKNYLVELFNSAIEGELITEKGNYPDSTLFQFVDFESNDEDIKGTYQLSYMIDFGKVTKINIEFINENNEYLSNKETLDNTDKKISEEIKIAEKDFLNSLNATSTKKKNKPSSYNNKQNNDLNLLYDKLLTALNQRANS